MHQDIARHEAALGRHLLAAAHLDHFLGGDQNLIDFVRQTFLFGRFTNLLGDFFLEIREHAHRIPTFCHTARYLNMLQKSARILFFSDT